MRVWLMMVLFFCTINDVFCQCSTKPKFNFDQLAYPSSEIIYFLVVGDLGLGGRQELGIAY